LLEKNVTLVDPEVDVRVELHALASDADPAVSYAARYPTSGFTLTVIRDADHMYDATWFLSCATHQHVPDKGSVTSMPSGLSVRTNDWVLPGEGVTVSMYRKPERHRDEDARAKRLENTHSIGRQHRVDDRPQ
jgi:hypothetical protein